LNPSNLSIVFGLALMVVSEAGTLAHIEPFWSWNTPIAWTGFILFADSVVWRARGDSWIRSAPHEFVFLSLVSIPLWLIFEFYNQFIDNWFYVGLPDALPLRLFGYAWSFSTIWPAIFEGAELVGVLRAGRSGGSGTAGGSGKSGGARPLPALPAPPVSPALPALSIALGAVMLLSPFFVSATVAQYLAAPVWLGFIFLLDPINARLGEESLLTDFRNGDTGRLKNLLWSGLLCGLLWEFWNYWSRAKWHYTVPLMEHTKLFEMPLPGFLGFPPFAVECFTMYAFTRGMLARLGGRALGRRAVGV
jgi:hypothetical protein